MARPFPQKDCDDVDWNEVWKARQDRYDSTRIAKDTSHDWDKKENADRYAAQSAGEFEKRIRMTLDGLSVSRTTKVLDIGAGPGRLRSLLPEKYRISPRLNPGPG